MTGFRSLLAVCVVAVAADHGDRDIWTAVRTGPTDAFDTPITVAEANSTDGDWPPAISADGRIPCFTSDRPGGLGSFDLWVPERDCL
jgi:hypothetical protein